MNHKMFHGFLISGAGGQTSACSSFFPLPQILSHPPRFRNSPLYSHHIGTRQRLCRRLRTSTLLRIHRLIGNAAGEEKRLLNGLAASSLRKVSSSCPLPQTSSMKDIPSFSAATALSACFPLSLSRFSISLLNSIICPWISPSLLAASRYAAVSLSASVYSAFREGLRLLAA